MKSKYLIALFIGLLGTGCSYEEPNFFTDNHFIKFKFDNTEKDYYKLNYNFSDGSANATEYEYTFPVEFTGRDLTRDMYFNIQPVPEKTTLPASCYSVTKNQVFRAGIGKVDSVRITLFRKTEILQESDKVLYLKLVNSSDFQLYMPDSSYIEINVKDISSKPVWWDETIEKAYLGTYSRTKYEDFKALTGISDFGSLDASEKRHYAILFKRDLERNPRPDEQDPVMSVTIAG